MGYQVGEAEHLFFQIYITLLHSASLAFCGVAMCCMMFLFSAVVLDMLKAMQAQSNGFV